VTCEPPKPDEKTPRREGISDTAMGPDSHAKKIKEGRVTLPWGGGEKRDQHMEDTSEKPDQEGTAVRGRELAQKRRNAARKENKKKGKGETARRWRCQ